MGKMIFSDDKLIYLTQCDSTNTYAKEHLSELAHGTVIYTLNQTGGRGRLGRSWVCQEGDMLAFSLVLHGVSGNALTLIPLCSGVGVCHAIGAGSSLKWPNDVLLNKKKLCGILCESRVDPNGTYSVVIGIGINLAQTEEYFSENGLDHATSLKTQLGDCPAPRIVLDKVLSKLSAVFDDYFSSAPADILDVYSPLCLTLGKEVRVNFGEREVIGTAKEISSDGSLLVEVDSGTIKVSSGEASVRGIYGYIN